MNWINNFYKIFKYPSHFIFTLFKVNSPNAEWNDRKNHLRTSGNLFKNLWIKTMIPVLLNTNLYGWVVGGKG